METSATSNELNFPNKKSFLEITKHDLTEEEAKFWWNKFGKLTDITIRNSWAYFQGRIGSCSVTVENSKNNRSSNFNKHPNWRPLAHYSYSVRGWGGDYIRIEGYCQSWEEIRKTCSDTENMTFYIQKHPHQ